MKIPDAALQQHIAILGKTGSGKTFAAKGIVEGLLAGGACVGIVDPTSAWWGLRHDSGGKGPGFKVLVLGGDHGDIGLAASSGAAVARLLVEQRIALVADTGLLSVGERTRWFIDFATTVYRLNRAPLHLVLDEAHNFAPQGKVHDPDAGKMLHAANSLASGGRSRGIRLMMITQRPQKLAKDTLTSADTLIALRVLAPQDRDAVRDWVDGCGDRAQGKAVLDSLASLQRGEGWVWYPEGQHLERARFPAIRTFDSSATPTAGQLAAPKHGAELDLTEIKASLAEAIKETEANDPRALRARIAELERRVESRKPNTFEIEDARRAGFEQGVGEGRSRTIASLRPYFERLDTLTTALREHAEVGLEALAKLPAPSAPSPTARTVPTPARPARATPAPAAAPIDGVSKSQQRILEALAMLEGMRIAQPTRTQLALWADVSPTSGGYFNNLGALRSAGLIDYPAGGTVTLTDAGRDRAPAPEAISAAQMQEALCAKVGAAKAAILRALIHLYPRETTRDALAGKIGVSPTSGGYFNNLGALRTLGVIDYPSPGKVVALPVLFLET